MLTRDYSSCLVRFKGAPHNIQLLFLADWVWRYLEAPLPSSGIIFLFFYFFVGADRSIPDGWYHYYY